MTTTPQHALLAQAQQHIARLERAIAELLLKNERLRQQAAAGTPPLTR